MQDKVMRARNIDYIYDELDKLYTELWRLPEDDVERKGSLESQISSLEAELGALIRNG